MGTFGTSALETSGRGVMLSADGDPIWKTGGLSIDWSVMLEASGDTTLADGTVVKDGDFYCPVGTLLTRITASGKFGRYQSGAGDGRQTLTPGSCYFANQTIVKSSLKSDHVPAVEGGRLWKSRVLSSAVSTNPASFSTIVAAFPNVTWVGD